MAFTKKSWQDHLSISFGQEDENVVVPTAQTGLIVGGVYNSTAHTYDDNDFAPLQVDGSGNLMVNLATGEIVASLGTIGSLQNVGTLGSLASVAVIHNAGTLASGSLGTVAGIANIGSCAGVGGTVISQPVNGVNSAKGTVSYSVAGTAGTLANTIVGLLRYITIVCPDLTGTGTSTLKLKDSSGGTLFISAALADTAVTNTGSIVPMTTDMSWIYEITSGTQAAVGSVVFNAHYER